MSGDRVTRRSPSREKRKVAVAFDKALQEYTPIIKKKASTSISSNASHGSSNSSSRLSEAPGISLRQTRTQNSSDSNRDNNSLVFVLETAPNDTPTALATMAFGTSSKNNKDPNTTKTTTSTLKSNSICTNANSRRSSPTTTIAVNTRNDTVVAGSSTPATVRKSLARRSSRNCSPNIADNSNNHNNNTNRNKNSTSPNTATTTTTTTTTTSNTSDARPRSSRARRSTTSFRPMTVAPTAPKAAMSAYDFYLQEELLRMQQQQQQQQQNSRLSKDQLDKKLKHQWKTNFHRTVYNDMERDDQLRYEMELHQYNSIVTAAAEVTSVSNNDTAKSGFTAGLARPAATATTATASTTPVASLSKPKVQTRGTQTIVAVEGDDDDKEKEETEPLSKKTAASIEHCYKSSSFRLKHKKRNELLEQHRKLRRQKMKARRKGVVFVASNEYDDDDESSSDDEEEYTTAHSQPWQVEKIIGQRDCFHDCEFLIRWQGKDPSWDSWETIASVKELVILGQDGNDDSGSSATLHAFWDQLRIFAKAEAERRKLMEEGAKEMGLDQWGEAFSKVEDLVEIPLDQQQQQRQRQKKPIDKGNLPATISAAAAAATMVPKELECTTAEPTKVHQGKEADDVTMEMGANPKAADIVNMDMDAKPEAETESPSKSTGKAIVQEEAKESKDVTMEMDTKPEAESTTVSSMARVQMELDTQEQPEPRVNAIETTTVSTMTLANGRIANRAIAESPTAMETDEQNPTAASAPGGGSSETGTAPETDTETEGATEPTTPDSAVGGTTSPNQMESSSTATISTTPLRTLTIASFGHKESEWSEPGTAAMESPVPPNNSTTATTSTTPAAAASNLGSTEKAAVPETIEARAKAKPPAEDVEAIVIDDSDDDDVEKETERDEDTVVAEVITRDSSHGAVETAANTNSFSANGGVKAIQEMKEKNTPSEAGNFKSQNGGSILRNEEQHGATKECAEFRVSKPKQQIQGRMTDNVDIAVLGLRQYSYTSDLSGKRPAMNGIHAKFRKRRRNLEKRSQHGNGRTAFFQVPSTHDMRMQEVRRINVFDIDAKEIVTESRRHGHPIVLTNLLGHPQFATRWLRRWNGQNRDDDEDFEDGDSHHHQHEELLDLSQPHELDIVRMIEDIGVESVPILKKNYSETKPIVKETYAENFLRKCWPRNGRQPAIKGLYLHQWQFPRSETAASKLCGHGNCATLPNRIVGEDLLQFWLDGKDNPYQYIFMGGADTFSKLHKDSGGLDITIAPIVGDKECIMVHRHDESYLYGMKSKLDNPDLDKYPMTANARAWKTVVKPGELLWMPAGTFHQCRNVTPCLSYHRFHLDTINLKHFFESLFMGDATEIEHDEVIWNCTIELIERIEKFLECYRQQPTENVPEHITETAATLCHLRPLCREIAIAFDPSCKQIHFRPQNKLFRSKQTVNSRCWPQIVDDIDLTLHNFNHRNCSEVPEYLTQAEKPDPKPPKTEDPEAIQRGLDHLQDSSSVPKEGSATGTSALQRLYENLSAIQPFQEGVVIPDSTQLKSNDKVIFRIGEKQCSGRIVKIEDQLRSVYLTYSRLPSYFHEYRPMDSVNSEHASKGSQLRTKQIVYSAIGGKGKPVMATVQSVKVATFYLVRFSMDAKSAKLERWLCRDAIISKEN